MGETKERNESEHKPRREIRCVYVAGAYDGANCTEIQANMRRGFALSLDILNAGFSPFCPWLDWQFGLLQEVTREQYLNYSMDWLRKSDAVILVPVNWKSSAGTRAEIKEAERLDIPVYLQFDELLKDAKAARGGGDVTRKSTTTKPSRLASPVFRLAIVGPARAGKDYVREWLNEHTAHVATYCTSWFAAAHVWRHWQMDHHGFGGGPFCVSTPAKEVLRQFWEERKSPERREYWAATMAAYNWSDGSGCRLYREMVEDGQTLLVGIRRQAELEACVREGIVENVVYVEGGTEDKTCELTWMNCRLVASPKIGWWLNNTKKDADDIDAKLREMCERWGIEVVK